MSANPNTNTNRIQEKMKSLRAEADTAIERAELAEARCKALEQEILGHQQERTSLSHKLSVLDTDLQKAEGDVHTLKSAKEETDKAVSQNDQYRRKIEMLEAELDAADKNLKETTEKLRQVDIRAEHFERQVAILEQDKDKLEKKYEESEAKYRKSKADLDALVLEMESI